MLLITLNIILIQASVSMCQPSIGMMKGIYIFNVLLEINEDLLMISRELFKIVVKTTISGVLFVYRSLIRKM